MISQPRSHTAPSADTRARAPRFRIAALVLACLANATFLMPELGPAENIASGFPNADKLVHSGVFAFTTWAILRATTLPASYRRMIAVVAVLVAWAWAKEGLQAFMAARVTDPWDTLADCAGIILGLVVFLVEQSMYLTHNRSREPQLPRTPPHE